MSFDCGNPDHDHSDDEANPIAFIMKSHAEAAAANQAAGEVMGHEIAQMLNELSQDHLVALNFMLNMIADSPKPVKGAGYFLGRVAANLEHRFGLCPGCGSKHDDASEIMNNDPNASPDETPEVNEDTIWTEIGSKKSMTFGEMELMAEYGLDDVRDMETKALLGFICVECNMRYVSIQDRMLKPVGVAGCSGCQEKAAWG